MRPTRKREDFSRRPARGWEEAKPGLVFRDENREIRNRFKARTIKPFLENLECSMAQAYTREKGAGDQTFSHEKCTQTTRKRIMA